MKVSKVHTSENAFDSLTNVVPIGKFQIYSDLTKVHKLECSS